jgi:Holliday junction resolvase RusA-like endonuclease
MLTFSYPFIPPSINSSYGVNNKRMYTHTHVKVYKEAFLEWSKNNLFKEISKLKIDPYDCFSLTVSIYFPLEEIVNVKYGKDGRAKSPFKRLDIDNRIKLLQDCIALVIGGDDKQIFNVNFSKKVAKTAKEKRVDISIKRENLFDFVGEIEKANGKSG